MQQPRLYGMSASPYVQAAMLGLAEKPVAYEFVQVSPPDLKTEAHLARHPFGRMPAFDHGDFRLYETQAILRYIDEVFAGAALVPPTVEARARMNQVIGIVDAYVLRAWSGGISFECLMAPRFFGRPTNAARVEASLPEAHCCAAALEALVTGPFVTGDHLSLADLHLAPHFNYLRQTEAGAQILADKPKLAQWFQHLSARPTVADVLPLAF